MTWLLHLFTVHGAAQAVVVLTLTIALGVAFGHIRIFGISLGVGGVLFSGLALGHFGLSLDHNVLEFAREFGLILFVYTIGIQVGPGFTDSLKRQGLGQNLLAALIVLLGVGVTAAFALFGDISVPTMAGLFSGATTNTPSLGAASQAFLEKIPATAESAAAQAGLGYAVAYPFGIFGIILVMLLVRLAFRIDPARELKAMQAQAAALHPPLATMTLQVANPGLDGIPLQDVSGLFDSGVVVSRVLEQGQVSAPSHSTVLRLSMLLHIVGLPPALEQARTLVGKTSAVSLLDVPGPLEIRRFLVTRREMLGKTVRAINLPQLHGVALTRITRSGTEFSPGPDVALHFGDMLQCVGHPTQLADVGRLLGNSLKDLNHPQVLPIFVGIVLGALLGSLPVALPGLPSSIKLGLAGGPLLTAIVLSRLHRVGPLVWYMPTSANLMLREVGICLFLACVGLKSGDRFVATLIQGQGVYWMFAGACITFVPLVVAALVGRPCPQARLRLPVRPAGRKHDRPPCPGLCRADARQRCTIGGLRHCVPAGDDTAHHGRSAAGASAALTAVRASTAQPGLPWRRSAYRIILLPAC